MSLPLDGILVVSMEQAVAGPFALIDLNNQAPGSLRLRERMVEILLGVMTQPPKEKAHISYG